MSLAYHTRTGLTVPEEAFLLEDTARLLISGACFGGIWIFSVHSSSSPSVIGVLETEFAPRRHDDAVAADEAVNAAEAWLREECVRLQLKLVQFCNMNSFYEENEPSSVGRHAVAMAVVSRAT